jgi:hypothetical protein
MVISTFFLVHEDVILDPLGGYFEKEIAVTSTENNVNGQINYAGQGFRNNNGTSHIWPYHIWIGYY